MRTSRQTSEQPTSVPALPRTARALLLTLLGAFVAMAAQAQTTAVFSLSDKTNLTPGTYQIYVTGFSTAGPYVLQPDGSWGAPDAPTPPATTATLPCYRFPQDISQVEIDGTKTSISGRVYYFVVTDKSLFPSCNPVFRNLGTCTGVTVTQTSITMASGSTIPLEGCTIVVPIESSTPGTVINTTSTLVTNGGSSAAASAPLTVVSGTGPTLINSIVPSTLPAPGGTALLTLTLGNPGTAPLTLSSAFTDTMPSGVTTGGNTGTCTGVTVTSSTITMASGSTIPVGGCSIVMTITASTTGTVINTTGSLVTSGGTALPASAPLTVGSGSGPTLIKAIVPSTVLAVPGNATLTLTLGNPGTTPLTLTSDFTDTMPAGVAIYQPGLFNVPSAFTYTTTSPFDLATPSMRVVTNKTFPAWTFSEIGASSASGTIDLSQVDFFAFPMNTTATVSPVSPPTLAHPAVIGNPVSAIDNPGAVVNIASVSDSYRKFVNGLVQAGGGASCVQPPPMPDTNPIACAYLDLLQNVTTGGSAVHQYVIKNPGGFLAQNTSATQASRLNGVFDGVIATLWAATGAPTLTIDTGGILGGVPDDVFTSTIVTVNFPNSSFPIKAMKFTGTAASGNYIAYVFDPKGYQTGCGNGSILTQYCSTPASTGYQVFAGDGALNGPFADTYTQLLGAGLLSSNASTYGAGGYNAVVGRLGFLISGAMNRGVALVNCPSPLVTWQCWQDETYWYPTSTSTTTVPPSIYPDITQNLFSQWMHTATIGGTPMFKRPPSAVKSAVGTAGAGKLMGMAYGFSNDEKPTPAATSPEQPEVPSKMDQTVVYGGAGPYAITFGPWVTDASMPTLSVNNPGGGVVTSSPAGINCGTICSHAYAVGTTVTLTATPNPGAIFHQWQGACTSSSTTCTVTMNAATTVTAVFYEIGAMPPSVFGLHVVVSGTGTVTSAPSGIDCGSTCGAAFNANTLVTLSAASASGATFAGWTGACTGTVPNCQVTMSQARSVGAAFIGSAQVALTVTAAAGGIVTTSPGGIDCGTRCVAGFNTGSTVSVIARPDFGYRFAGWSGACSGTNTCDLIMNAAQAVQASFAPVPAGQHALTVHDFGDGTVISLPAGINCGTSCSASFAAGTEVFLTPVPGPGQRFAGWSGACSGLGSCAVWMDNVEHVYASFVADGVPNPGEPISTLSEWAMLLLALLMLVVAGRSLPAESERRRRELQ